ncbi:MAG: helix-turn-helix transcriptional regulator [Kiritimatiellae bacterium]|nr:helix-turn-helix transcriptional regulator [Kiritimatiellia bacterium]
MFEPLLRLPTAQFFGRAALRLPSDAGLPEPSVRLDRICRTSNAPGTVWNEPRDPIVGTLRIKFCLAGRARTRIGREDFVHEAGTAILIRPGEATRSEVPAGGPPWDFAYAALRGAEAARLGRELFARTGRRVPLGGASETVRRFEELFRRMSAGGFDSPFAESLAAYGLLAALWDDALPRPAGALRFRMDAALRHLAANAHRNVSVRELAAAAGLSESHLHRAFLRETGKTPHRYHLDARLALARETLRDSPLSVKETAARFGFADVPNFTRLFKRAYGAPPGASRAAR